MKLWTAYKQITEDHEILLFTILASLVAKERGIEVGLIANNQDRARLRSLGFRHSGHIDADLPAGCGAIVKLAAINKHLPQGDALIDGDLFLTSQPLLDPSVGWALNWEPLRFYRHYSSDQPVDKCWPSGNRTINAGLLYAPPPYFRQYAQQALGLSRQIQCIGHTYEQMFFVRFCQDSGLPLRTVIDREIHAHQEVEQAWQDCQIRHPFCYKHSLRETQRCIDVASEFADPDLVFRLLAKFWPFYKEMATKRLFAPL